MRKPTRTSAQRWASLSPTGRFSDWQTLCNAELHGDASNYSSGRDGRMSTTISRAKKFARRNCEPARICLANRLLQSLRQGISGA